jgi:UDP:flavonoid glycosyltransferase YjiC (YdhE family)
LRIVILTLGTRGDVQPYIALGRGLQARGHVVTLATTIEFETLVGAHGLRFARLRGDFLKAARAPEGQRTNFFKQVGEWVAMARDTLDDEWQVAREAEVLVYNLAALGGEHIAEKLGGPAFAAFPTPLYTPTRAFASPFFPVRSLGPFNPATHRLLMRLGPALYGQPIGAWRRDVLGLPPKPTFKPPILLYAFSEAVVPRPPDWPAHAVITGYWFLDRPGDWTPPRALAGFLDQGPAPVYVGFGSMYMAGGAQKTEAVVQALAQAGLRAVIATGWGGLTAGRASPDVFFLDEAPHDWLFPRVAAVVHHGGAGTTAAGLRAGLPSVICPLVGDQTFWGNRVADLGAGPPPLGLLRFNAPRLAAALTAATDPAMRQRAAALGHALRAQDGVAAAVNVIEAAL